MRKKILALGLAAALGFSGLLGANNTNTASTQQTPQRTMYTIQNGDTLWAVARKNNVSVDELKRYNPDIVNPDYIRPGQRIYTSALESKQEAKPKVEEAKEDTLETLLQAEPFTGPDRVNHTSGYHIGGKRSLEDVTHIVYHWTTTEGRSAENHFHNHNIPRSQQFSAHYIIERDGTIVEIVNPDTVAYHASGLNKNSIGIEVVAANRLYESAQIKSLMRVISHYQNELGIPDENVLAHKHVDGSSTLCPGPNAELVEGLLKQYSP